MKNFKKLSLSLLTSFLVLTGFGLAVSADEKTLNITYSLEEGYEWSIPSDIVLQNTFEDGSTTKKFGEISVNNVVLLPNHTLKIEYGNVNLGYIASQEGKTANFFIGKAAELTTSANRFRAGDTILSIPADYTDETVKTVDVYSGLARAVAFAGSYSGTVKFVASIVETK